VGVEGRQIPGLWVGNGSDARRMKERAIWFGGGGQGRERSGGAGGFGAAGKRDLRGLGLVKIKHKRGSADWWGVMG